MRTNLSILAVALVFLLTGCNKEAGKAPESQPAHTETAKPATSEAAKPEPKPQDSTQDTETVTNNACMAAAKQQTGEPEITISSNEFSEANTLVMLAVGAQKAPWRCLVSNDGNVAELSFEGNDGDGVPEQRSSSDVSDTQLQACLEAVKSETNEDDLSVLGSEFSEANSVVLVGVGAQQAPWRCLVSNDGQVQEVSSQTDEGKL